PLGALTPVVMMDVTEAQRLLFMRGRVNAVLVSNLGDELDGVQYTDQVNARLRAFSLNPAQLDRVTAILRRADVAAIIRQRAPQARNPVVEADDAPQFFRDFIEGIAGVQGFRQQVEGLAAALGQDNAAGEEVIPQALTDALTNTAVREWLLDLPLPRDAADELDSAFQELDDFQVLTPLSKQFALQGADIAGFAFGSMFTVFGAFSILAGVLLIFLIFVMLAAERRSELGISRAVGMQRGHLVQMFVSEGLVYDLAAALVGLGLGLLVSYAMIGFLSGLFQVIGQQLSNQAIPFQLRWSVAPPSLVIAYCGGVLLTFIVVAFASWRVSRLNIVAAIRGLPDTGANGPSRLDLVGRILGGPGLLVLGAFIVLRWREEGQTVLLVGLSLL
ncbi:MAG: ABC transporter permease, partial [Caldilineae bacterium]